MSGLSQLSRSSSVGSSHNVVLKRIESYLTFESQYSAASYRNRLSRNVILDSHEIASPSGLSRRLFFLLSTPLIGEIILTKSSKASPLKTTGQNIEEIKTIIEQDIANGQYFVTGNLTKDIYEDDCVFKDPTNETQGLEKYLQAVSILFDPQFSKQELVSIQISGPNTIEAEWTLGGVLKFPWRPRVAPFSGSTTYTINESGLISRHEEKWSISPLTALVETFTPSFN